MSVRPLAPEELKTLSLFANGMTTEQIGAVMKQHKSVVQAHLRNAARKLGAANRVHAVAIATELGLINSRMASGRRR